MKVWILGAGGQVGKALIDRCQALNIPFVAAAKGECDITDLEALKIWSSKWGYTHVANCAAYTDVDGAEEESKKAYAVNAKGPENLGIVAREEGLRVIHLSTDYVFDGEKREPYCEGDQVNPLGVYGKSKWEGEVRLLDQLSTACIIRTSWVFGLEGKNFISSALSLLQSQQNIEVVEDQLGRATYNKDLALCMLDLACHSGIFHFANGDPLSRFQIVTDFLEEARKRQIPVKCEQIVPISMASFPVSSIRPPYSVLDTKKVTLALGRKPRTWDTVRNDFFEYVQKT